MLSPSDSDPYERDRLAKLHRLIAETPETAWTAEEPKRRRKKRKTWAGKIRCRETGKVYSCVSDAARAARSTYSHMYASVNSGGSVFGLHYVWHDVPLEAQPKPKHWKNRRVVYEGKLYFIDDLAKKLRKTRFSLYQGIVRGYLCIKTHRKIQWEIKQ